MPTSMGRQKDGDTNRRDGCLPFLTRHYPCPNAFIWLVAAVSLTTFVFMITVTPRKPAKRMTLPMSTEVEMVNAEVKMNSSYNGSEPVDNEDMVVNKLAMEKARWIVKSEMEKAWKAVNEVKVLCWVMTGSKTIAQKGRAVLDTWGAHCDKLLFMTSQTDKTEIKGRVSLRGVFEGRKELAKKSKKAWLYVYEHYKGDYDFFYKCDDDTFTIVQNLKLMVGKLNPLQPVFRGMHLTDHGGSRGNWLSGGAGYVLSRQALIKLIEQINAGCMDRKRDVDNSEDVLVAHCMSQAGIRIGNSHDAAGRSRILPLSPQQHLAPKGTIGKTVYKWIFDFSPKEHRSSLEGFDCCSDMAIAFHYVPPDAQYALYYLTHRLHPFGTSLDDIEEAEKIVRARKDSSASKALL